MWRGQSGEAIIGTKRKRSEREEGTGSDSEYSLNMGAPPPKKLRKDPEGKTPPVEPPPADLAADVETDVGTDIATETTPDAAADARDIRETKAPSPTIVAQPKTERFSMELPLADEFCDDFTIESTSAVSTTAVKGDSVDQGL